MGSGGMSLSLQRGGGRPGPPSGSSRSASLLAASSVARCFLARACRAARGWSQLYPRAPRFRQPNRNGLLRRASTMFPFTDMLLLFAHHLSCLRARSLAFSFVFSRTLQSFFFRHLVQPF